MALKQLALAFFFLILISCTKEEKTLFTRIPAEISGITFNNSIIQTNARNVFNFEYVFNGGGVALADFNNDSLVDVYFTGNQVENKLYLNQTKNKSQPLNFKDVTEKSKATGEGRWCAGATVVDINNDNLLDIYVSATVSTKPEFLANMMYVNQGINAEGIPVFKDMALEYGIADTTHTTSSAFFDYDNDGDLDLYLLVNEMEKVRYPNKYVEKIVDGSSHRTDRLYKNDGTNEKPHFTNVSKQAGILIEGYGLGLNITDINRDGWKDIYITNDFLSDDLLYINNKNGTFSDQAAKYFKHTSFSAMGNDVTDLNNDGLVDIIALDMLPADNFRKKMMLPANNYSTYQNNEKFGYNFQYSRNTLQVNQGYNTDYPIFSETGLLAGIAETDWSWCPLVTDFDNDGFRDIIITNGFPKDVTDHDYLAYRYQSAIGQQATLDELLAMIPSIKASNYAFKNKANNASDLPQFDNVTQKWGMEIPSFSNGAAYADLDNDGDLDYVVNNINDSAFVFQNNLRAQKPSESNYIRIKCKGLANNRNGIGAWVEIYYNNGQKQVYENTPYRGYLSTIENIAHFGLSKTQKVDSAIILWPNGKRNLLKNIKSNQIILVNESESAHFQSDKNINDNEKLLQPYNLGVNFVHQETDYIDFDIQKLLPHKLSQFGPAMAVGDVNSDGLDDIFIAGPYKKKGTFLLQNKNGKFLKADLIKNETDTTKLWEDAAALLFDADNDKDLDLYIVSGGVESSSNFYQDRLYQNDGKGNFIQNLNALPIFQKSGSCVKAADFDKDGDLDLFVGGRSEVNAYPKPVSSYILRNDSKIGFTKFINITENFAPNLLNIGLVTDAIWSDFNGDSWPDLVLTGEGMATTILLNKNGKKLEKLLIPLLENEIGFWNSILPADFDNDGDIDYVLGNQGINTINKISNHYPMHIYGKYFNADALYDAVPTVFFADSNKVRKQVPFNVRDDLIKQLNNYRDVFDSYRKYASTDINGVFSASDLEGAIVLKLNNVKSIYIENLGGGKVKISNLPLQAQASPIFGMAAEDLDQDGNLDIIIVGNDFGNEVSVGRLDAQNGTVLKGDGKGIFTALNISKSGFYVPFDAKALIKLVNATGQTILIASQNRADLKSYSFSKNSKKTIATLPTDCFIFETLTTGKIRKVELYFGGSFFSQSSRNYTMSQNTKSIEIVNYKGQKRRVL